MERRIIHIDMDAFYASVEQRENPELKGKPLAVGFDGPRGVVATASYEARKFGVHSAMAMSRAKSLCPQLVIVPCNFTLYKSISAQIHNIFHEYTELIEPISLDEAFLDVTNNKKDIELGRDIAIEIKQKILETTGLTASAGVSYNKFLAKIASDYRKPNGLTVIHPLRALDFIAALPVEDFWGVGPKTAEKMHGLGIYTGAQLRKWPLSLLTQNFGKAGKIYYDFSRGIDERPVEATRIRKSVGCEETFLKDISDDDDIKRELDLLADNLLRRLDRAQFHGRTFSLKVKFYNFEQITRSISPGYFIQTKEEILELSNRLMDQVNYSASNPIRLIGLSVSNPEHPIVKSPKTIELPTLFDHLDSW